MSTAQSHTQSTPFSRNLKGIFFFLVALIVVSQISPLLLLNGLIDQEEERADGRLNEAAVALRDAWMRTNDSTHGSIDIQEIARDYGMRHVVLAAFLPDANGGAWHYRAVEPRLPHKPNWDSTSLSPPRFASAVSSGGGAREIEINDIWGEHPVQARLALASPVIATLKRQFRVELYLRGVVLASFMLFTLLFYRSVLLPFHDMRRRAAALVESGVIPPAPGGNDQDPEYVMATFDTLVHKLMRQAGQMEQRALHSEKVARDVERFNEYILASMTTGMIILDEKGEILRFNRAAEQILRLPSDAMIGRHYSEPGLSRNLTELFDAGLVHGEMYSRHELKVERDGAEPIYLGVNTSCIKSDTGQTVGLSVLMTDLTAIKKLQDEVAENQRLADLGELAAGLAHQLRNSMAAILGYGRLVRKSAPEDGQLGAWADGLLTETNETSAMITRFLDFARPLHTERQTVNLVECIDAAISQVAQLADETGVIIDPFAPMVASACIEGDEILLRQVFVNLIQNAVEASTRGAHVTITLQAAIAGSNGQRWLVTVHDQGCGIAADIQARIFQPFFTTKDTGTGLGLALARKIIVSHGGGLTLQQSSAAGSTFAVMLPVSRSPLGSDASRLSTGELQSSSSGEAKQSPPVF